MPSGIPGNSLRVPLPKFKIIGSAILKPLIQPDLGSPHDDSMIEGRTIDNGMSPRTS